MHSINKGRIFTPREKQITYFKLKKSNIMREFNTCISKFVDNFIPKEKLSMLNSSIAPYCVANGLSKKIDIINFCEQLAYSLDGNYYDAHTLSEDQMNSYFKSAHRSMCTSIHSSIILD